MLTLLSDFLDMATTPEEKIRIEDAFAAFDRIGLDDYEQGFEQIIECRETDDATLTMDAVLQLVAELQHKILSMHLIFMTEDTTMRMNTNLIHGLMDLQEHEERAAIKSIVALDMPTREVFCELMAFVTEYTVDTLLEFVKEVSPSLIARIKEIRADDDLEGEEVASERKALIDKFTRFDLYLPNGAPSFTRDMLKQGVDVGMPFTVYAAQMGNNFEQLDPAIIAEEMFAMALVSIDGNTSPLNIIKDNLDRYVSNADTMTAVMTRVIQLTTGFKP
jgi:hypothetical protein